MAGSKSWERASAGTYEDASIPKGVLWVFVVVVLVLICVPSVGMLWARTDSTTENHELASLPTLIADDDSVNPEYLQELGTYFDDHFAYRNEAVTANARLRALFDVSATEQVVIGSDGWLYYGGTLHDYLGQNPLTDRELSNIAHNLSLVQGYVESRGGKFLFTLAPNKNSLYPDAMPYYYDRYEGQSNAERLVPYLDEAGVHYLDLFAFFEDRLDAGERFHYLKEDSHWDNYWALLGADALLEGLDRDALPLQADQAQRRAGAVGDLESMLYPTSSHAEDNYFYEGYNDGEDGTGSLWSYIEGDDVTDDVVRTEGEDGSGSLLMFRDSFGNALIPYLASSFEGATFSKLIPYNISQISNGEDTDVIIERAERHLSYLATAAPIMASPTMEGQKVAPDGLSVSARTAMRANGPFMMIEGSFESDLPKNATDIRVVATLPSGQRITFIPFLVSSTDEEGNIVDDRGFTVFAPLETPGLADAEFTVYTALG